MDASARPAAGPGPDTGRAVPTAYPAAGLVLAAGAGRRYGAPKALVRHEGSLLVERAVRILTEGGAHPVLVVLGAAADQVRAQATLDAELLDNPRWRSGMGSSLRLGLDAAARTSAAAVLVLLVDMPGVTAPAVARLRRLAAPDALAVAGYPGGTGHPVLLGRAHWAGAAAAATGDRGARDYLASHPPRVVDCADVADGADLDTPPQPPSAR